MGAVPRNLASALNETSPELFPNIFIFYLLNILALQVVRQSAVFPHCVVLKTYLRSTMRQDRLTGLALMHVHQDIPINISDIVEEISQKNPRRMSCAWGLQLPTSRHLGKLLTFFPGSATVMPSKTQTPVGPFLLIPAHTCNFTGCFGLSFNRAFSPSFR